MKLLIKTILVLMGVFFSTFLIIKFTGIFTIEDIKYYFEILKEQPSYLIGSFVVLLVRPEISSR